MAFERLLDHLVGSPSHSSPYPLSDLRLQRSRRRKFLLSDFERLFDDDFRTSAKLAVQIFQVVHRNRTLDL